MHPLVESQTPHLSAWLSGGAGPPRAEVEEALGRLLVPSSIKELGRRGYRDVKVLSRDAVERMVADAAARLAAAARSESAGLAEALEVTRRALAAEREERQALERWRADVVRRLEEAEARARASEARLAEARAAFEAQLGAVIADPFAFAALTPERRRRRKEKKLARRALEERLAALGRENAELRAAAAAVRKPEPATPPATPAAAGAGIPIERIVRLSFGFGKPREEPPAIVAPPAPPDATRTGHAAADPRPPIPGESPAEADTSRRIERRLDAIEAKIDALLGRAEEKDTGVPSRFRDGKRAGLDPRDRQFREKSSILRKLLEENVKLQKGTGRARPDTHNGIKEGSDDSERKGRGAGEGAGACDRG